MGEVIFRALLRLYPSGFRERYGSEQVEFFRQERAAMAPESGLWGASLFWVRTIRDGIGAALRLRLRWMAGVGASKRPGAPGIGPGGRGKGASLLEEAFHDVRFALRTLRKQLAFTLVAVGVLGLGIGASSTLFSAVNGVLLRPLPYPEQDRLVFLGSRYAEGTGISAMSIPQFMDVAEGIGSLEELGAVRGRALDLVGGGDPERVAVSQVSPGYFSVLGVSPALGPGFPHGVHTSEGSSVIMVSDGLWKRRWGADPDIVGRTVVASDGRTPGFRSYTVVGVLPPGFENPTPLENRFSRLPPTEIWAPMPLGAEMYTTPRTNWTVRAVGRLAPRASLEVLNTELGALGLVLKEQHPEAYLRGDTYVSLGARPFLDQMVGARRRDLLVLLGATGLLLLIACANVAGLMVARGLDRVREMGLRTALGAGRRRLLRQLLTESLVLALMGGGVGVGLAVAGVWAFRTLGPADFPRLAEVVLDLKVLVFSVGSAIVTGLFFGIGPAMAGSREGRGVLPPSGTRNGTAGGGTVRVRGALVALEVALALVLLSGCGLLTRSVIRLQSRDPGVDVERLALMQVRLLPSYDDDLKRNSFYSDLQTSIQALPGVVSVSFVNDPPMDFGNWVPDIWTEEDALGDVPSARGAAHPVGLDYFRTMGIPLLGGRTFSRSDDGSALPVTIVSRTLAETLWPGEDPLGKRLGINMAYDGWWVTVVGVAGDVRQRTLASEPVLDLYFPYGQRAGHGGQFLAIRTAGEPLALAAAFRREVWRMDGDIPIPQVTTMEARVDATLRLPRFRTLLLASFAGVALLLAGAGIYGTLMYTVGRRTPEVGIRLALGAEARDVVGLVVRQGMMPVIVGLGIGLFGSLVATRVLESVLFQTEPNDPLTFVVVSGILLGVSLLAAYLPARRASQVEPQDALRAE